MMALSEAVNRRATSMVEKYEETSASINELITSTAPNKQKQITNLSKELSKLTPLARQYEKMESIMEEQKTIYELIEEDGDEEWSAELTRLDEALKDIEKKISNAVLPVDDDDYYANAILEIRAGTGGDEAAIFAGDLLSSYEKTVRERGWSFEILTLSKNDLGGVREAAVSINSNGPIMHEDDEMSLGPYGFFKFESGVHRVQRVPVNDVRIHTSTASIAILPAQSKQSSTIEQLPPSELKIETMRAQGAGGQHVNTTESAVRITHVPTRITVSIQDERSQHKNKAKALNLITAKVRNKQREEEAKKRGDTRKLLMGGGERSERIRTYNFPQDRITDHRVKHTEHGIDSLLNGGLHNGLVAIFSPLLLTMHKEELLNDLESEYNSN